MNRILKEISVIKTLRFNFHYFPFRQALRLPVIVSRHVLINSLKGEIFLEGAGDRARVRIGFSSVPVFDRIKSRAVWNVGGGRVVFRGKAFLGQGTRIGSGGELIFGENFQVTAETTIICEDKIVFGRDVLCSWQCQIMDTDYHQVITGGEGKPVTAPVIVGDHVWIGSRVIINKGSVIPGNTVIAAGAVVTRTFSEANTLLAGIPAAVMRRNIDWK